jgi:hypothetical protein
VSTNIETTLTLTTDYTVALNADQNSNAGGNINMVTALPTGYKIVISSKVEYLQETDLTNQGGFYPEVITDALDRLTIEAQQLKEGLDRAAQLPITSSADAASLVADIVRIADSADNLDTVATNIDDVNTVATNITNVNTVAGISSNVTTVAGISANVTSVAGNATNINSVAGNASNINAVAGNNTNITAVAGNSTNINAVAGNSTNINAVNSNKTNIDTCATNIAAIIDAPTQAANAASSAAAAAASAASGMYSGVQDKSANYTVVAGDAGDLIRVTTTSGAVTITLPLIGSTGITDGFKIAVVKWTSDSNAVNIARSGSNTINGATSAQIGSQYSQIIFVADAETSTWFASQSGLGATNVNVDVFSGAGGTAFTLSSDPSSKNNTYVSISGVYQAKSTYSVSGTTLTFSTAPPTGTSNIEVVYGTPLAIGTPSDGTVSTSKIVDGNVTAAKLASGAAVSNIGYTPVNKSGDTMTGLLTVQGSNTSAQLKLERVTGSVGIGYIGADDGYCFRAYNGALNADGLRVDQSGRVITPYQPAFKASITTNAANANAVIPFDTVSVFGGFNRGNCFNTSTYRFTAPVAGVYQFNAFVSFQNSNTGDYLYVRVNGTALVGHDTYTFTGWNAKGISVCLNLNANDYVDVYHAGSGSAIFGEASYWSSFSGYFVG